MRQYITILLCLCSIFGIAAQTFRMPIIYEASGPVKEINFGKNHPMTPKTVKFNPYGMSSSSTMTFDLDGYPIGCSLSQGEKYNSTIIEYDADHQPATIIDTYAMSGTPIMMTVSNSYQNGYVQRRVITESKKEYKKTITLIYSNQESDSFGNWISRTVTETTESTNPKENGEKSYQEIRQITYFSPEELAAAPQIPDFPNN